MPLPAKNTAARRNLSLIALLAVLLIVPTALGFAVANAGESHPPTAAEQASGETRTRTTLSGVDQAALVAAAPLANAPNSAADALTRQGEEALGIARLTFDSEATGRLRVENGGTIPMAGGYQVTVTVDPYPPDSFAMNLQLQIARDGVPITNATIDTVWDMTLMGHGPFATTLTPLADGNHQAAFDFFMFGPWAVDSTVTIPGDEPLIFRVSVYVWPA